MKITTVQFEAGKDYVISRLYIDGVYYCYIIEDPIRKEKIKGITAISRGIYDIEITMSNRFKKYLPLLLNVPNFEGVRIHTGNTSLDTEGCLIPGLRIGQLNGKRAVLDSKKAFEYLFFAISSALDRKEKVTIELK